jgi:hypothetical protein
MVPSEKNIFEEQMIRQNESLRLYTKRKRKRRKWLNPEQDSFLCAKIKVMMINRIREH